MVFIRLSPSTQTGSSSSPTISSPLFESSHLMNSDYSQGSQNTIDPSVGVSGTKGSKGKGSSGVESSLSDVQKSTHESKVKRDYDWPKRYLIKRDEVIPSIYQYIIFKDCRLINHGNKQFIDNSISDGEVNADGDAGSHHPDLTDPNDLHLTKSQKVSGAKTHGSSDDQQTLNGAHSDNSRGEVVLNPFMVVIVESAPENFEARNVIRSTYGKFTLDGYNQIRKSSSSSEFQKYSSYIQNKKNRSVKLLFALAKSNDTQIMRQILSEDQMHHDIIQFNFEDSYRNLLIKTFAIMSWFNASCLHSDTDSSLLDSSHPLYLFKTDDDMYLNIPELMNDDSRFPSSHASQVKSKMWGKAGDVKVGRDPQFKFFMPYDVYTSKYYPEYASGGGYIMSYKTIEPILRAGLSSFPHMMFEDVVITGILVDTFNGAIEKEYTGCYQYLVYQEFIGPSLHQYFILYLFQPDLKHLIFVGNSLKSTSEFLLIHDYYLKHVYSFDSDHDTPYFGNYNFILNSGQMDGGSFRQLIQLLDENYNRIHPES